MRELRQVNRHIDVDGEINYNVVDHAEGGYVGRTTDTVYSDGAEYTDWCIFVGTEEECQLFIARELSPRRFAVKSQQYTREGGWDSYPCSPISGVDEFIDTYMRVSKGDANSTEAGRSAFAVRLYNSGETEFKWYKSENARLVLVEVDEQ